MTLRGVILGTAAYMAPEQAKGRVVDKRADIWAFGCVLYEMLTGRKAFAGEDVSDTLASILKSDVDWTGVPPRATRLLKKCLEKDPRKRLHDVGDAWDLLDDAAPSATGASGRSQWLPWSLAAFFAVSTIGIASLRLFDGPPAPPSSTRFQILPPPKHTFDIYMVVAPDGRRLAFTARNDEGRSSLWVRDFDSMDARQLPGTEGATGPFWSPDGRELAFFIAGTLRRIAVAGGPPQKVAELQGNPGMGAWSQDGIMLLGSRAFGGITRVPAAGGNPEAITRPDSARGESAHAFPTFLPDNRSFLYYRLTNRPETTGFYVGSIDKSPEEQNPNILVATSGGPAVVTSGHLLFLRDATVMAQAFDASRIRLSGEPVPISERVGSTGSLGFLAAAGAVMAYRTGVAAAINFAQLTWIDRKGATVGTVGSPLQVPPLPGALSIAPDGRQAALMITQTPVPDIWVLEFARGLATRFTFTAGAEASPVWSPDNRRIAFLATQANAIDVLVKDVSGTADAAPLMSMSPAFGAPVDWSADGRFVIVVREARVNNTDLWAISTESKTPFCYWTHSFPRPGAACQATANGSLTVPTSREPPKFLSVRSSSAPQASRPSDPNGACRRQAARFLGGEATAKSCFTAA